MGTGSGRLLSSKRRRAPGGVGQLGLRGSRTRACGGGRLQAPSGVEPLQGGYRPIWLRTAPNKGRPARCSAVAALGPVVLLDLDGLGALTSEEEGEDEEGDEVEGRPAGR